jgi:hypothetical protein
MLAGVVVLRHDLQVRRMIVVFIAVNVMDNLARQQCSAEHLLGYHAMLVATMPLAVGAWLY